MTLSMKSSSTFLMETALSQQPDSQVSVVQSVTKHLPAVIVCSNDLFVCLTLHSTPMGAYDIRPSIYYLVFFLALRMCILFCDILVIRNLKIVKCFS